jgi:hypothetical protein
MRVALVTITVMGAILLSARLANARDGQPCIAKAAEALPRVGADSGSATGNGSPLM